MLTSGTLASAAPVHDLLTTPFGETKGMNSQPEVSKMSLAIPSLFLIKDISFVYAYANFFPAISLSLNWRTAVEPASGVGGVCFCEQGYGKASDRRESECSRHCCSRREDRGVRSR
jgi:hypothetical protein